MTLTPFADDLRESAVALASSGAWSELCTLFAEQPWDPGGPPTELALLRAEALLRTGHPREARAWMVEMLPFIERRPDRAAIRRAVNILGVASFELGELSDARLSFQRALDLAQQDHDDLLIARATNNLGAIANVRAEREQALAMYALAIAAYQRLGQVRGLAMAYHNMGITFRHIGLLDRADESERRAIELAIEADNAHVLALARIGRAEVSLLRGDARFAEATAVLVAREFADRGDVIQQADALRVVGAARLALGDLAGAEGVLDDGIRLARSRGGALVEAELLRTRAELRMWQGAHGMAVDDATESMRIFERLNAAADRDRLAKWLDNLVTPE